MAPKVFVSHASEDKQRFVTGFAQRLREHGVDAWLDQWEMQPGDSLVDKVFEEGLKNAQAVVIVISATSISKPWVREELNLSVVKRIGKGLKLIPVVIDQCDIPQSLQSTVWQRIDDVTSYDAAFQRILAAIFDTSAKPALGLKPALYAGAGPKLAGLTRTDELILREIAVRQLDMNEGGATYDDLREDVDLAAVTSEQLIESLDILEQNHLVVLERYPMRVESARLTLLGFRQYAQAFIDEYPALLATISGLIVNEKVYGNQQLVERSGKPIAFIDFILDVLTEDGHITVEKYGSGAWEIFDVSPSLKRTLG